MNAKENIEIGALYCLGAISVIVGLLLILMICTLASGLFGLLICAPAILLILGIAALKELTNTRTRKSGNLNPNK